MSRPSTPPYPREWLVGSRALARDLPFDARPIYGATLDDMDLDRFRSDYLPRAVSPEVLAANHRTELHQLMAHRLVASDAPEHPTGLGVLLPADEPSFYLPGAYVDFIRINGRTLGDPIRDQRRFTGPISQLINTVEDKLALHTEQAVDLSGPRERHAVSRRSQRPLPRLPGSSSRAARCKTTATRRSSSCPSQGACS